MNKGNPETLLAVQEVSFAYGKQKILNQINFQAGAGEMISIIGANGSGKSTLLKLLGGYERPKQGKIMYRGRDLNKISIQDRAKEITILYQNCDILFPFTCMEMVWMGRYPLSGRFEQFGTDTLQNIVAIMEQTECIHLADKQISEISGGEMQKVLLARALAQEPQLLLLDEAMSDFDIAVKIKMSKLLKDLTKTGLTVISVNHDINSAYRHSDRIIALHQGTIVADGATAEVITEELLNTVFGIKGEIIPQKGIFLYDHI